MYAVSHEVLSHDVFGRSVVSELKGSPGFWFLVVGLAACAITLLGRL
ncbi:MAG: hypothetical protein JO348_15465 [Alphaproteobacteria bacterium]|nr:hypothetical protein [Alphaproteobacteria bacterium]MBV9421166.1 hypothetical protein [Alphaproteobacteria bacterium]